MENTHTSRALKLSWNSRAWFAKNFISVSAAVKGSIGKTDGLIPGQECNKGRESSRLSNTAGAAATQSSHSPAEAAGGQES